MIDIVSKIFLHTTVYNCLLNHVKMFRKTKRIACCLHEQRYENVMDDFICGKL